MTALAVRQRMHPSEAGRPRWGLVRALMEAAAKPDRRPRPVRNRAAVANESIRSARKVETRIPAHESRRSEAGGCRRDATQRIAGGNELVSHTRSGVVLNCNSKVASRPIGAHRLAGENARSQGIAGSTVSEALVLGIALMGSAYLMAASTNGHPLAAWFALFPLFVTIAVLKPWQASIAGAWWGCWVFFLAEAASSSGHPIGSPLLGLRAFIPGLGVGPGPTPGPFSLLLLAGTPAVYAGLASWLTQRIGYSAFVLGVGWMAVELVFSRLEFNIGLLGSAQPGGSILSWLAHALGSVFVGFIIAYVNAACVALASRIRLPLSRQLMVSSACIHELGELTKSIALVRFVLRSSQPRAPPTVFQN